MKKWMLLCALALGCVGAQADEDAPSKWRFVGRVGMGFGSDAMISDVYESGTRWELSAGNGLKYAVGADYRVAKTVTIQATFGKELSTVPAGDGDLTFNRTPVELLAFVDLNNDFRLGGGLRNSTEAKISASGDGNSYSSVIGGWESSIGAVVEGQYIFASSTKADGSLAQFGGSLRLVSENFKKDGMTKSGDHVELGLFLNY